MRISYHERQGIAMEENNNEVFQPTPPRRRRRRSKWQNFKEAYLPAIIAAAALHERQGIAMEENNNEVFQPTPPRRRRRRSKWQNFKEAYLPAIIAAAALILIIVFIVGSVKRSKAQENPSSAQDSTISSSEALQMEADSLLSRAAVLASHYDYQAAIDLLGSYSLLSRAAVLASHYDYQAAIDLLGSYSAGVDSNEAIKAKHEEYRIAMSQLVDFTDVEQVPVLGFNLLMADLPRSC